VTDSPHGDIPKVLKQQRPENPGVDQGDGSVGQ